MLWAAAVICMVMAGCGDEEEDLSARVEEFNASIVRTSFDISSNSDIYIGSVNMGMNGEWYVEVMNGIQGAANDLGVRVKLLDSENDLEKEKQNIDELMDEGIDAMVVCAINYEESAKSLQKVKDAEIPIVAWNTTVNLDVDALVSVDPAALGGDTGDYVVEYVKTNNLSELNLIILGNETYDIGVARCDGFKDAIQDLVASGVIHIIDEDNSAQLQEEGIEVTKELIEKHPDVDMIWAWNQGALLGCVDAIRELGRKDIVIMGADMSLSLADDMLKDEVDLQAITTQLPYNMGYKAVVYAVAAVKGEPIESKVMIPVSTYTKDETDRLELYIETHKGLVEGE